VRDHLRHGPAHTRGAHQARVRGVVLAGGTAFAAYLAAGREQVRPKSRGWLLAGGEGANDPRGSAVLAGPRVVNPNCKQPLSSSS